MTGMGGYHKTVRGVTMVRYIHNYNSNFIKNLTLIDIDTLIYWLPHLEKNDNIPCLIFSPKNQSRKNIVESVGPRIHRRKLFNRISMEEKLDDGVIRTNGNGLDEENISECYTKIYGPTEVKTENEIETKPELYYLKEHRACDTGPVPLNVLRKEFRVFCDKNKKKSRSKIIRVKYIYE